MEEEFKDLIKLKQEKQRRVSFYVTDEEFSIMSAFPHRGQTKLFSKLVDVVHKAVILEGRKGDGMKAIKRIHYDDAIDISYREET